MSERTAATRARTWLSRQVPARRRLLLWTVLLEVEVVLAVAWAARPDVTVTDPLFLLLPFVWIDVALLGVLRVQGSMPSIGRDRRLVAAAVGLGYVLLLSAVGGLLQVGAATQAAGLGLDLGLPPGWGPTVSYAIGDLAVTLIPYKVAGYAALAYLVYRTVVDAAGSVVSGALGLFSCVSCTWPVVGTVLAGVFGGSSTVVVAAQNAPYLASTAVFVSAVALLTWRPSVG